MLAKWLLIAAMAAAALVLPSHACAKDDAWVEVKTPNFKVISNAGEKKADQVAVQFETIRAVFRKALEIASEHPTQPITVLAVKDEKALSELLPEYWTIKGHSHPAGLFYSDGNRTYVALRTDTGEYGDYETIYHEYYHSLTVPYLPGMPLWVLEGTAEFFGHSQIIGKQVRLGEPDSNLLALLQQQRMPLSDLMKVDASSPYYNEQNKTSIFYAESWALIHYLMLSEDDAHRKQFRDFLQRIGNNEPAEQATQEAFGDLNALQKQLSSYIALSASSMFTMATPDIDAKNFTSRQLSEPEIDAILGDSFVRRRRLDDAEPLLKKALALDPQNAFAHGSYGFLEYARGDRDEAERQLKQAIDLNSDDYLTYYYDAKLLDSGNSTESATLSQIENELERAITLNPNFAPSYSALAFSESAQHEKWPDALRLSQKAVQLEPANLILRINLGQVLMRMNRAQDALKVVTSAKSLARTAQERSDTDAFIASILQYVQATNSYKPPINPPTSAAPVQNKITQSPPPDTATGSAISPSPEPVEPASSIVKIAEGSILEDNCSRFVLNLVLADGRKSLKLHAANYAKVEYWAFNRGTSDNFNPCADLKGSYVRVSYNPTPGATTDGEIQKIVIQPQRSGTPTK